MYRNLEVISNDKEHGWCRSIRKFWEDIIFC